MSNAEIEKYLRKFKADEFQNIRALPVDDVLEKLAFYLPLTILSLLFIFSPEFIGKKGIQCFHPDTQGAMERVYINGYCWENVEKGTVIGGSDKSFSSILRADAMKNRSWSVYLRNLKNGPKKYFGDTSRKNQG